MAFDNPDDLRDLFSSFGPVNVRRMFGGQGVFADGMMFALVASGVVYLKADDLTVPRFVQEGSEPFTYTAKSKHVSLSYWRLPERLYDEPESFAEFARGAFQAAQRAARKKK